MGGDPLCCESTLPPYRAIAMTSVQVARISVEALRVWLPRLPGMREQLLQRSRQWEQLIFLKTSTNLYSLTSHQIRQLLPLLTRVQLSAGERLEALQAGYFWLRQGTIQRQDDQAPTLRVGDAWEYPMHMLGDWVAQADLILDYLPLEHCQAATAIAPTIFPPSTDATSDASSLGEPSLVAQNGHLKNGAFGRKQNSVKRARHQQAPALLPSQAAVQSITETDDRLVSQVSAASPQHNSKPELAEITFPQPQKLHRRKRGLWQNYPFIAQQSSSDCGVACLAMISQYWGKRFSLNRLRNLASVGRSGASLKNLAAAAEDLGFQSRPVRASLGRLANQSHPWIAHWQSDHYVVVYRVNGDRVLLADPAVGKQSLSRHDFQANWTGYALLADPTERLQEAEDDKLSLKRFWGAFLPYRSILAQIIFASLLLQVFGLVTPLFTQIILDKVVVQKSTATLNVFAIGLLLFGIWRIGLTAVRQYLLDYFANRMDLSFIGGFINHALRLPLQFFESRQVGDIITRVQENQKIQLFLTRQAVSAWLDALSAVVYIGLMAYYNWRLTLLVLLLLPPIVGLTVFASPFLRAISRAIFKEAAAQNSALVEMFSGVATVKAAAAEREIRWLWEDRFTRQLNEQFRGQKLANGLQVSSGLINTLGSTVLLWYGATLVIQDQLTIGQFVAFNMLIGNVIGPVLSLVNLWDEFQEVLVSVERLNDVFEAKPEESSQLPMLVLPKLKGEIRFENVTFRYQEDDNNVLQNISFEAHPGETIALVGRSGSGKSTLVKLMQGLYQPVSGRVWVDGHDIHHVSPASLRSQLGVVPQECFLFSGTILENITLFRSKFTLEDAIKVAKLAEAHAFIEHLPLGYNTKVGERGTNLSGGQRQRLAIARALLGDPPILILDEATSSLDTESERRFQTNLTRLTRDRTTFIIAHRLSTVCHANTILVLDRGHLAEQGTHEELVAQQGLYYHLAQQQISL
nr:peptidase domain-containing ABC transporter [Stenomitos frigidus]